MAERIGDFLVRTGSMTLDQVQAVLQLQAAGDKRRFGEIAVAMGYLREDSIKRYVDYLDKQRGA